jgi:sugar lactone lactonase YvrE
MQVRRKQVIVKEPAPAAPQVRRALRPPAPEKAPAPPAAAAPDDSRPMPYDWVLLVGLAVIVAIIDPIVIDLQHHMEVSLVILAAGVGLLWWGLTRERRAAVWTGAAILWAGIIAGIATQIAPLGVAAGTVWAPRGALLVAALLGWLLVRELPRALWRGVLALAVPTLAVLAWLWWTAPAFARAAQVYWLATDSRGNVYASDDTDGVVWRFDSSGHVLGKLWPRWAKPPGTPGPGYGPAGISSTLLEPFARRTAVPIGPIVRHFSFCGIAIGPDDGLYTVDLDTLQILHFDRDGQLRHSWPLPAGYVPAQGCIAADSRHLYLADLRSSIHVYDFTGHEQTQWPVTQTPHGLAPTPDGRLLVLHERSISFLQPPTGQVVREWTLPPSSGVLLAAYQTVTVRHNGEVLITDYNANMIVRYAADGTPLPAWGGPGTQPGQFAAPAGITEGPQGQIYAADSTNHAIQRFQGDGQVDLVWSASADDPIEAGE